MNEDVAAKLTVDQIETLAMVPVYRTDKEIAQALRARYPDRSISHHAVKERLRRARRVLGVNDRWQAADMLMNRTSVTAYPPRVYPPSELPFLPDLPLNDATAEDGSPVPSIAQELRDGEDFSYDRLPEPPPRRWHDWLFRRAEERTNDLTFLETIRSIAVATLLLALAVFLMMKGLASWR